MSGLFCSRCGGAHGAGGRCGGDTTSVATTTPLRPARRNIEDHGTAIAAKFAREKKERPTDWVIWPSGELEHVGGTDRE